jgi:hypothetical protein
LSAGGGLVERRLGRSKKQICERDHASRFLEGGMRLEGTITNFAPEP